MEEIKQKSPNLFFNEEEKKQKKDTPQKKEAAQTIQQFISLSTGKLQISNQKTNPKISPAGTAIPPSKTGSSLSKPLKKETLDEH